MKKRNKMDTVIFSIYEICHKHQKRVNVIMITVDLLLFLYYLLLFNPTPWPLPHGELWNGMYAVLNPFTTGAYIMGAAVLIQYIVYDNWIIKVLVSGFYGWIILISLVVTMGMTSLWELYIYIPHPIVIILCVMVTCSKQKVGAKDAVAM